MKRMLAILLGMVLEYGLKGYSGRNDIVVVCCQSNMDNIVFS